MDETLNSIFLDPCHDDLPDECMSQDTWGGFAPPDPSLNSEVYKWGVMDMGGYEKLPNTEFSIEKLTILVENLFFQNLILGMWEGPGESLELSGRPKRLK